MVAPRNGYIYDGAGGSAATQARARAMDDPHARMFHPAAGRRSPGAISDAELTLAGGKGGKGGVAAAGLFRGAREATDNARADVRADASALDLHGVRGASGRRPRPSHLIEGCVFGQLSVGAAERSAGKTSGGINSGDDASSGKLMCGGGAGAGGCGGAGGSSVAIAQKNNQMTSHLEEGAARARRGPPPGRGRFRLGGAAYRGAAGGVPSLVGADLRC